MVTVTYSLIAIAFFLISLFLYRFFKKSKNSKTDFLTEEDLKPFLEDIDLQQERKVRKQWLISFFIYTIVSIMQNFFIFFKIAPPFENVGFTFIFSFVFATSALVILPWFWITYHCSYKKKGTAWLLWSMIFILYREIASLYQGEWNQVGLPIFAVFHFIEIAYWVTCLGLFKVNSAIEYQKVLALKNKFGPDANGFCN